MTRDPKSYLGLPRDPSKATTDQLPLYFMVDAKRLEGAGNYYAAKKEAGGGPLGKIESLFGDLKALILSVVSQAGSFASSVSRVFKLRTLVTFLYSNILRSIIVGAGAIIMTPPFGWLLGVAIAGIAAVVFGTYLFYKTDKDEDFSDYISRKIGKLSLPEIPRRAPVDPGKVEFPKQKHPSDYLGDLSIGQPTNAGRLNAHGIAALTLLEKRVPKSISTYLQEAAQATGIATPVLAAMAHIESRFGLNLNNKTSSAQGIMQMLPSTFNDMVSKYGKQFGITRKDIQDPRASILMGSFYLRELLDQYASKLGGRPTSTDLYILYLLGPSAGLIFLTALKNNAQALAHSLFPSKVSVANKNLFYDADGKARTVSQMYSHLDPKIGGVQQAFEAAEKAGSVSAVLKDVLPDTSNPIPASASSIPLSRDVSTPIPQKVNLPEAKKEKGNAPAQAQPKPSYAPNVTLLRDAQNRVYAM